MLKSVFDKYIPSPTTIAFALTYQCTAQCINCCFGCTTEHSKRLYFYEIKNYIEEALCEFGDSVKTVVLTGGECMIFRSDVEKIIQFAHCNNLRTRIVTNAFWANSLRDAITIVNNLKDVGLNEINFSTGDNHQEWVSYENIVYACTAAVEAGLKTAVNIEIHDNAKFTAKEMLQDERLTKYLSNSDCINPLKIEQSLWIPFKMGEELSYNNLNMRCDLKKKGCSSIFSTIAINPYSQMLSCCGLTCEHILPFRLGNLKNHSMKTLYDAQFADLIKIWLSIDGPYTVLTYIRKRRGLSTKIDGHICYVCAHIFKDSSNIQWVRDNYKQVLQMLIFKLSVYEKERTS